MPKNIRVKSNLKRILDEREISIRELSREIDYRFESLRKLYNDDMERLPRDLIARLCVSLGVSISELLTLEEK